MVLPGAAGGTFAGEQQMQFATYPSLNALPVVISGGATGIGAALVRAFAEQGSRVGFVDIAVAEGEALAGALAEAGHTVRFTACDITDTKEYRSALAGFEAAHGPALALVNNAANDTRHDWREVTPETWDRHQAVNLKHAFFAIQAVAPGMIAAGRGSIINFGSVSWMVMSPRIPAYLTAKAAAKGLTRGMARELGGHGIRVNTLTPGQVMTEKQRRLVVDEAFERHLDSVQALAGRIMPEDIARMALFLAADDSRMISGQDFLVDAGWAHG